MTKLPADVDPALAALIAARGGGELVERMGIELLEVSADYSVATMPVAGNRQPAGLLHGGAYLVLGETLGSLSSAIHAGRDRFPVGIEISATHSRSATEGVVTGTCRAISLGSTLCSHEIVVTDEEGRRLSTVRITNLLRDRR